MSLLQTPRSLQELLDALSGDKEKGRKALSYLLAEDVVDQQDGKLFICK